jgi:multidrug efflux pump subunit AcrA (membrane-fusion protein)
VGEVLVGEGTRVPAAGPLVTIALQHRIEVRLGIEPEDVGRLQVSQPVALTPVDRSGGTALMGRIRSIGQQVSPETRLVEVLVALPAEAQGLLLNQFVRGDIELRGRLGLIVPRAALLPREDRFALFTVRGGRAVRRQVDLEAAAGSLVQVRGEGLGVGDSVVVLGNYELGDSMRVQVAPPTGAGNR